MYIACPRCDWHPQPSDLWMCSCGHHWHTFATHGVCPACGRVWKQTQCFTGVGCGQWSDHEDWYHEDDDLTVEEAIAHPERIAEPAPDTAPSNLTPDSRTGARLCSSPNLG